MADAAPTLTERLQAARAGSREALGSTLDSYRGYLLHIARRELDPRLAAKSSASDLVQETFLEAYRDFGRFRGESDLEMRSWLRCLLLHHASKLERCYRATAKRQLAREVPLAGTDSSGGLEGVLPAEQTSPSNAAAANEQALLLHRSLEQLPDDYRRVVHLRYVEGRSFDDIAALMGRSANAVTLLWFRAVRLVRGELERAGGS